MNRQIDRRANAGGTFAQYGCASIGNVGRAGREYDVLDTVESDGRCGDFAELLRRLAGDRTIGFERFADRAELALRLTVSIPDAILHDRRCQNVAPVERRDLPIRDAVGRRQSVKRRLRWKGDACDGDAVAFEQRARTIPSGEERRASRCAGVHRHHNRAPVDRYRLVIRWPGAAPAARGADRRVREPQPKGLQFRDQVTRAG